MNPETFLEQFGRFTDAKTGFVHLRQLILEFAVRGKLTEQFHSESGEAILSDARHSKEEAIEDGRAAKKGFFLPIKDSDTPFPIPTNWVWIRIGDTVRLVNGKAFKPSEWTSDGLPIVRIQNLNNDNASFNRFNGEVDDKFHIRSGDFLISWSGTPGTSFGAFIWERGHALLNQHIFRCEIYSAAINMAYLRLAINARLEEMISKAHGGVGLRHITKGKLEMIPLPLPPLAEQKRIVAKVDQLMALCDRLEAQQQEREAKHTHLTRAALARFHEQPSPANLNLLFHKSFTIPPADLRKTILQLAVQGKLSTQSCHHEPAKDFVSRIEEDVPKKQRGPKMANAVPMEVPFDLPSGWTWARFRQLGEFGRGKSKHRPRNDPNLYTDGKYPLVQTGDVARANGEIATFTGKYNEVGLAQSHLWPKGTFCITIAANIADTGYLGFESCFPDSVVGFIPHPEIPTAKYFDYFMRTAKDRITEFAPSTAQKNINLGILNEVLIPFPPLLEMEEIVTKVEALMKQVDHLEAQLTQSRATAEKLMEAIVAQLTTST